VNYELVKPILAIGAALVGIVVFSLIWEYAINIILESIGRLYEYFRSK
jgi:hypothetical protein